MPAFVPSTAPSRPGVVSAAVPDVGPGEGVLRAVLGALSVVALRLDAAGTVTYVNEAMLQVTGWAREDVLGAEWAEGLVPAQCAGRTLFQAAVAGDIARGEGELCTRDGDRRIVVWDAVAVCDASGRSAGAMCVGRDVTEERRLIRDRERLGRELATQADHDVLTGVLNRRGFVRSTEHARRVAARTHRVDAVLAVRLHGLTAAGAHGAAAVDDAVCAVAEALRGVMRDSDLVARVAPDVFAVYAVGTGTPEHGEAAARRVRAAVVAQDDRARAAGRAFDLGCAVGAAERGAGEDLEAMLACALGRAEAAPAAAPAHRDGDAWESDGEAWRG